MFNKKQQAVKVTTLGEIESLATSGKPVLIDFYQVGCAPCQVMDGIMNELSREYGESAHILKADITRMPDAMDRFKIRSTPTMVLLGSSPSKKRKKVRNGQSGGGNPSTGGPRPVTQRWRGQGLIQKDFLAQMLESNGAQRVS